jgi:hypothetical protein
MFIAQFELQQKLRTVDSQPHMKEDMKSSFLRASFLAATFLISATLIAPLAFALDAPKGKVLLTISGNIDNKNKGKVAVLDFEMLDKMNQKTFKTKTPWYPEARAFTGPLMSDLLKISGAKGKKLKLIAMDDYITEVPISDMEEFGVIMATKMDGERLDITDKGPLFLIYPFDSKKELKSVKYYERAVWQIKEIKIK